MHITHIQLFQTTKIQIFESNSQQNGVPQYYSQRLFQTTKIQIFESNSQHNVFLPRHIYSCFKLQRYKFLKAIHNIFSLFCNQCRCFKLQRYKFLKAIHNMVLAISLSLWVVSNYKDTNF